MEATVSIRRPKIEVEGELLERARKEKKAIVLYPTLKFSCLIAKRFRAELAQSVEEYDLEENIEGVRVFVKFRAVGSRFCGREKGFEEFDFPIKEPERFFPKWIKVNKDLSGEFGYL